MATNQSPILRESYCKTMSGQYVNPVGNEALALNGLGLPQAPARGYYGSRIPVGLDADTFETNKPVKPDRLLLKWFKKSDSFLKASVNSATAAVGGIGNYFKSMFWSKEEGFFRGLKTAGCIIGFGLAASAGFMLAPTFTAAALAGLTAFGVAAGTVQFGWSGLKWAGNMMLGKYDRAVEAAHDAGEAGIDVATNLTGARQATNAVMRLTGNTGGTSNNPFNLLKVAGDLWDTVGNRNFFRNGMTEARKGFVNFKSNVRLYSEHSDIVTSFEALQQQHQQVNQGKAINTFKNVFDIEGHRVYDSPIQAPNANITFHSSYQINRAGKMAPQRFMRVKVEMGPSDATALLKSEREFQTKYYDVMLDDMPRHNAFRIQRNKLRDGTLYETENYQLHNGQGFTFDPNGERSEFLIGRLAEGTINLFGNARRSLVNNLGRPIRQQARGYTFEDIGNRMVENDAIAARVFNPSEAVDSRKVLQTFTAREMDASAFNQIPFDGEIQPTIIDRLGGLGRALLGFKDDNGFHPGLLTNPEVLRASQIARTNLIQGEEAQVVTQALTRHQGHLNNPQVFLYNHSISSTTNIRQYLVRANGNDYILNFSINNYGELEPLAQTRIAKQLGENAATFIRGAIHESENNSTFTRKRNWWLGRSEQNRPVYSIQTVPTDPHHIERIALNDFLTREARAGHAGSTPWTMDSNMVSTGITGKRLSKHVNININTDDEEEEADEAEKKASRNPSTLFEQNTNPFNINMPANQYSRLNTTNPYFP